MGYIKKLLGGGGEEEYVELDIDSSEPEKNKVIVKPFVLRSYDDMNDILNSLREGYTIAVIDIKALKSKDVVELNRSIAKLKKTVEAMEGNIRGFGDNLIIATPPFADITSPPEKKVEKRTDFLA